MTTPPPYGSGPEPQQPPAGYGAPPPASGGYGGPPTSGGPPAPGGYGGPPSGGFNGPPGYGPPPKKRNTGLIAGIIGAVVVLIAAGVLAYFLLRGDDKTTANDHTTPTTNTTKSPPTTPPTTPTTPTTPGTSTATGPTDPAFIEYCSKLKAADSDSSLTGLNINDPASVQSAADVIKGVDDVAPAQLKSDWDTISTYFQAIADRNTAGLDVQKFKSAWNDAQPISKEQCGVDMTILQ